jgi:hypothetical protein
MTATLVVVPSPPPPLGADKPAKLRMIPTARIKPVISALFRFLLLLLLLSMSLFLELPVASLRLGGLFDDGKTDMGCFKIADVFLYNLLFSFPDTVRSPDRIAISLTPLVGVTNASQTGANPSFVALKDAKSKTTTRRRNDVVVLGRSIRRPPSTFD